MSESCHLHSTSSAEENTIGAQLNLPFLPLWGESFAVQRDSPQLGAGESSAVGLIALAWGIRFNPPCRTSVVLHRRLKSDSIYRGDLLTFTYI